MHVCVGVGSRSQVSVYSVDLFLSIRYVMFVHLYVHSYISIVYTAAYSSFSFSYISA